MERTTIHLNDDELRERVRKLLLGNLSQGYAKSLKTSYCFIKPSPGSYPFQFWWDTGFHVFILCALGEYELAKQNMLSLFAVQEANGFIGHMISWKKIWPRKPRDILQARPTIHQHVKPNMSALIEPPMVAQSVWRIYEDTHDLNFVSRMLPKLKKYFMWLASNRDLEGNGLISIITTFESGMDWKPTFDPVVGFRHGIANKRLFWRVLSVDLRNFLHRYKMKAIAEADYFLVKEVCFNTLYAQDLHTLARLCSLVHDPDAELFEARAEQVTTSMLQFMYDKEAAAFFDLYGHNFTKSKILTPTIFFPMLLPGVSSSIGREIIERHLFKKGEFQTPYPLPSVAVSDPSFYPFGTPTYLWRGPTWVSSNWLLYQCLHHQGFTQEANKLLETVKKLIAQSGFREYYHPFTGDGYGADNFTWSGLVVDMLRMQAADQKKVQETESK